MIRQTIILFLLMTILVTTAQAQLTRGSQPQRTDNWEFTLQTRYLASQDKQNGDGSSVSLQDNVGWGFGFAYNFNQHFNLGMDFSWRSINYTATGVDEEAPATTTSYSSKLDTSTWSLLGNYHILKGRFTPFISGSFGWTLIDTNIFAGYGSGCWWDYWYGYVCSSYPTTYGTNTTVGNLGLGGRFELTPKFFIRVAYEHSWLGIDGVDSNNVFRTDIGFQF